MLRFLLQVKMPSQYIPILVVAILAASFPVIGLLGVTRLSPELETPALYVESQERAVDSAGEAGYSDSMRFYVAAGLFVIFDAAVVLLCVWAIKFSQMGVYGLIVMLAFLGILLAGYAWVCKKGVLDWI
jgi:NADH-quinone oxidoreductase subunit A